MAGPDPTGNFNAANFRTQIRATMQMGLPNTAGDAPIFRWIVKPTYASADPAGQPYNWTSHPSVTPTPIADMTGVDCAIEWGGNSRDITEAGEINQVSVTLTLLDVDQEALVAHGGRMPDQVLLKGIVYNIDYIPAPTGLFDVDVWTLYCSSTDSDGGN